MERIEHFLARKRAIAAHYRERLADVPGVTFAAERSDYTNVYWMVSILVEPPYALSRDELILALREHGIDSRPFFHPMDTLPPYRSDSPRPVALRLSRCGLNLPSSPSLTDNQIDYICDVLCTLSRR
jgi:perosamine synthetase